MGNQIYKEISKFAEMQRDEIKREKAKKKRNLPLEKLEILKCKRWGIESIL